MTPNDATTLDPLKAPPKSLVVSESLGKFFKADAFLKMTRTKQDMYKLNQEIKYQFSPQYRCMMDNIKKQTIVDEPKTFGRNQLYEPVKFYKLKTLQEDNDLEDRVQQQVMQSKNRLKNRPRNRLERNVFLDKIQSDCTSLKNHMQTAERFYNALNEQAFKKDRKMGQDKGKKVPNTRVVIVPVEEQRDSIMRMASEGDNEAPQSPHSPKTGRQSSINGDETDQPDQVQKKPTVKKKHFEAIRMKTAILKREKEEAQRKLIERNKRRYEHEKELERKM